MKKFILLVALAAVISCKQANPGLRAMYNENDDNTAVFFLTGAKATISSFTAEPVVIEF